MASGFDSQQWRSVQQDTVDQAVAQLNQAVLSDYQNTVNNISQHQLMNVASTAWPQIDFNGASTLAVTPSTAAFLQGLQASVRSRQIVGAVIEQPKGEDAVPALDLNELSAYENICREIGFQPAALTEAQILAFMAEHKIKRYDNAKVGEFLSARAKKELNNVYAAWYWAPLRAQDSCSAVGSDNWGRRHEAYTKAIPLRVLSRVRQFIEKFGDRVKFLVSDYEVKNPDPFIAAYVEGLDAPIVFDVWDEPDFK